jgi:hypothetical protein
MAAISALLVLTAPNISTCPCISHLSFVISGGPNSSFPKEPPVVPSIEIAGKWAVESVEFVYRASSSNAANGEWERQASSSVVVRSADQAATLVSVAMPKGLTVSARPHASIDDGMRVEAAWLVSPLVRAVVASEYNEFGMLVKSISSVERRVAC